MKRLTLLLTCFLVSMSLAVAQTKTVTGLVVDEVGEPVIGASVLAKGTNVGTVTGVDGTFSFQAPENARTITVKYIGYTDVDASISANMRIVLKQDAKMLSEVVVTALGISREKKTLGYSISSVGGEDIANAKTTNPLQALQGKVAGMDIMSSQSPGGTQIVAIRGYSSFGNNQPLYIVDGVPITNTQTGEGGLNSGVDFGSGINAINPNDIENITVLKGSAASSLYGSRAAQGVIMITTKGGKNTQGKINVEYDGGLSIQQVGRLPYEQTLFGQGWSGDRALDENGSWGAPFDGKERPWGNIVGDEQQMIPNTYKKNRIRDFYDLGFGYNNSVSFSAGTDRSTFRASLSQSHVDGPIPTDDDSYDRYTIGANASHKQDKLTVATSINFSTERNEVAPTGQDNSIYRSINEITTGISIVDLKDLNNKFNTLDNYFTPYGLNPYQVLEMREAVANKNKFFGKIQLDWDIMKSLKATYRFGGDYESTIINEHFDAVTFTEGSPNAGSSSESAGSYSQERIQRIQMNHDLMLNYNNRFDNFSVNAILGANTNERSYSSLRGEISSIYIPGFYQLSNSLSPATSTQESSLYRLWGVYLNADVGYKDFLYLTLTGRNDHSSTLPENKNSYFYGGAMLSFVITDLLKQKEISTGPFNFATLRLAYGRTGKDANAYAIYDKLVAASAMNPTYPEVDDLIFPLGGKSSFTLSNLAGNVDLSPELTDEFEIGAEMQFLDSRIGLNVSYYNKLTKGLISVKPMDPSAGYTSFAQANIGDVRNSGVELMLSVTPVKNTNFAWDISWNFTQNNNKVERLEVPETYLGGYVGMGIYAVEGKPIGQFKSQKALTVMLDENHKVVDSNGKSYTVVDGNGNPQPTPDTEYLNKDVNEKYRMGLTNTFTYKGISLSATLDYRKGGFIYCYTKDYSGWVGNGVETVYNDRNPFLVPNSVVNNGDGTYKENTTPVNPTALHTFYSNGGFQYADASVIDRTYLKLRDISLAYELPKSLCSKLRVNNIRASLNAGNILLWTPVENQYIDPEVTTFGSNVEAKFGEYGATPPFQTYVFGLSISF